ncbi:MAG: class I SAM-dependent methyltransferase [Bacteroidota bacterium]
METTTLNKQIQHFYDQSTQLWLDTWGEHMHHGYYGSDGRARKDRFQAQIDLINTLLEWGQVQHANRILDAGCGVGGSARFLANKFGASVLGVTLSPVQASAAAGYTEKAGLTGQVEVRVQDMTTLQASDGPFDLIYSMESAEHIADKAGLFQQFYDMLAPGGRLVMATWCHREEPPALEPYAKRQLDKLYGIYHLPPMVSISTLGDMAQTVGFEQVKTEDWSDAVSPFWLEVIRSALSPSNFSALLRTGWSTVQGAWAMRYMRQGYRRGFIRFGVVQGIKQ